MDGQLREGSNLVLLIPIELTRSVGIGDERTHIKNLGRGAVLELAIFVKTAFGAPTMVLLTGTGFHDRCFHGPPQFRWIKS